MTTDTSIFGLRFGANADLAPTREDLTAFLSRADRTIPGLKGLARYRELLEEVQAPQEGPPPDVSDRTFRDKMFMGAMEHSGFANPVLLSTVEEFGYHLHALVSLDFNKPAAFIKTAEKEMGGLNPGKAGDAAKLARLRAMTDDRKAALDTLGKRAGAMIAELTDIALYLRDNLLKIEKRCETSIVLLVDLQLGQRKEKQLIEDIKTEFKDRLRDSLHQGLATRQRLETAKQEVALLSKQLSVLLRDDTYALLGLFEAIHDHAKKIAGDIDLCLTGFRALKNAGIEAQREAFLRLWQVLVFLVSGHRLELKAGVMSDDHRHKEILVEKRKEFLIHVFERLIKERRSGKNRRTGQDRRTANDPDYSGAERRRPPDRRVRKRNRRAE